MQRTAFTLFAAGAVSILQRPTALAQKTNASYGHWSGPAHQMVQTQEAWAKTVTEASGGNLVIEIDKAPLAKPEGQYDLIKNGVRDLVWHIPAYTPGRLDMYAGRRTSVHCVRARRCAAPFCGNGTRNTSSPTRNSPTARLW